MKKRVLSMLMIVGLLMSIIPFSATAAANPFTDIVEGSYYYTPVLWAAEEGITSGVTPTTFCPEQSCTRGQIVTFLWRSVGSPEPTLDTVPFTDMRENAFYSKAVRWAVENEITSGVTPTTFCPEEPCTRGQIVTFLWRTAGSPEPTLDTVPFTDLRENAFYCKAVCWAVENEITSGVKPTTFCPENACTRGQIVTFLYRTMENESSPDSPITGAKLIKLMEDALSALGKPNADAYLRKFANQYGASREIQRYQLAQLLYGVYKDVIAGHDFTLSATAIDYEVGGAYRAVQIWDCPDKAEVDIICNYDTSPCNYAICAFDRVTGDKLMKLYDDGSFRPKELVTVESAEETVFHFIRSFEKDPVYTDVTDKKASVCNIDPALYTGKTSLPDATNQNLPDWRGCNISYNSMYAMALSWNPDDVFAEGNLDYLKELGVNFVHIYLSWNYFQGPDHTFDNKVNLARLAQLDEIISWCMERDIHIQLVFNDVPNLDFNDQMDDWTGLCNSVFTDEMVRDNVALFWRMLAKRYADIPNNYLSFNLMNECDPADDEQYVWGLGPAVKAIWEESPGRVVVADVHTPNSAVTGESMAKLGCALSYHFYNLQDISVVTPEKEAAEPGFYEKITGNSCRVNASLYGPTYWDTSLPEEAKGAMKFTGAVGGATLAVTIRDLAWIDTIMKISADGKTLYEGMEPYTYDKEADYIGVDKTVTVTIPENASSFEISCPEGSCFTMSDISLTLSDGKEIPVELVFDGWQGTRLAEVTIRKDGSFSSTLTLEHLKQNGHTLADLVALGKKYGVDVMVGECGFFEGGAPMAAGIRQEAVEKLFQEQIETFERLGLAWCFEYVGRYTLVTPAPYLEGIEYRDLENSPYYVNLEMDEFFRKILVE